MDDILNLNCSDFESIIKEIYPVNIISIEPAWVKFLLINEWVFVTRTTYLNLDYSLISPFTGNYNTRYTWKREKLPITPFEFIKRKSNRPFTQALNMILGPFHLVIYASSDPFMAFEDVSKLINKFCSNGFCIYVVLKIIIESLAVNDCLGVKFNPSLLINLLR